MTELADLIHHEECAYGLDIPCKRYAKGSGDPHYDFYQARAIELAGRLEPLIGWANILPVVRIVLDVLG